MSKEQRLRFEDNNEKKKIVHVGSKLLNDTSFYNKMALVMNPYGDGNAASKIASILDNELNSEKK